MSDNLNLSAAELRFDERQYYEPLNDENSIAIDYEFIYANFGSICRFCLKMKSENLRVREIVEENEETTTDELVQKINFTLYENASEKLNFKISNIICELCFDKIHQFYSFKKQCENSSSLLLRVKNEIEGSSIKSECDGHLEDKLYVNSFQPPDELVNEADEIDEEEGNLSSDLNENDNDNDNEIESAGENEELEEIENDCKIAKEPKPKTKSKRAKQKSSDGVKKQPKKQYTGKLHCCPICGKLCKGIQMHMLTHTGEKKYNCYLCPKSFTQSGQLKRHINSHLNIRNYSCSLCNKTFVDPSSVTKHMVVHNKEDRKYVCTLCGARFNRLGALRYHEKTHRQERNHVCDICQKSFLAKYDLTKHYRIHTGEKPYKCNYCDKRFTISKNAKVHMRVHTKERPYSCSLCSLSFSYRSSLKNHLVKIHNHTEVPASLPLIQQANIISNNLTSISNMTGSTSHNMGTTQIDPSNLGMPSIVHHQNTGASLHLNSPGMSMISSIDRNVH